MLLLVCSEAVEFKLMKSKKDDKIVSKLKNPHLIEGCKRTARHKPAQDVRQVELLLAQGRG